LFVRTVMLRRRESHAEPIYAIAFNQVDASLASVFATVGANRITVYRLESSSPMCGEPPRHKSKQVPDELQAQGEDPCTLTILQAYCDSDDGENFYCCAWGVDVDPRCGAVCGSLLAVGGAKRHVKLLDACAGTVRSDMQGHGGAINELQFHPRDRALLFSASADESIRLWHTGLAQCLATFTGGEGHRDAVVTLDIRLDGALLATGSIDGTVKLWSIVDHCLLTRVRRANAAVAAIWGTPVAEAPASTTSNRRVPAQSPGVPVSVGAAPVADMPLIRRATKPALAMEVQASLEGCQPGSCRCEHVTALEALNFAPLIYQQPIATYEHIHFDAAAHLSYWVDCVRFVGELLLSRASDGTARLWRPCNDAAVPTTFKANKISSLVSDETGIWVRTPPPGSSPRLIREFRINGSSGIWYLRFALDAPRTRFAMGNAYGEMFLWDLRAERAEEVGAPALPFATLSTAKNLHKRSRTGKSGTVHAKVMATVRCSAVSSQCQYVVGGCDDGSICVWALPSST